MSGARRALAGAVAVAVASLLGSCNILGPVAHLAGGLDKVEPRYEIQDRPTVVFVDDRGNAIPMNSPNTRRAIADRVTKVLLDREAMTQMLAPGDVMNLARQRDRGSDLLPLDELARSVGAEQLIYVEMTSFEWLPDGVQTRIVSTCKVKVIDAVNRVRLAPPPEDEAGAWEVSTTSGIVSADKYRAERGRRELQMHLAELTADNVARLFYAHFPDEAESRLDQR